MIIQCYMTAKHNIISLLVLAVLSLLTMSCASGRYAPKSPRRTHRCGDCPRFTYVNVPLQGNITTYRQA